MAPLIEVKRKDNESNESLLRRFSRKVQQSSVLLTVKRGQFRSKHKSKNLEREYALRRKKIREVKEYLRKIGKLDDTRDMYGRPKMNVKIRIKK